MNDHFEDLAKAATTHNVSAWMETTWRISEYGLTTGPRFKLSLQIEKCNFKMQG
jgi:hypothetical protein